MKSKGKRIIDILDVIWTVIPRVPARSGGLTRPGNVNTGNRYKTDPRPCLPDLQHQRAKMINTTYCAQKCNASCFMRHKNRPGQIESITAEHSTPTGLEYGHRQEHERFRLIQAQLINFFRHGEDEAHEIRVQHLLHPVATVMKAERPDRVIALPVDVAGGVGNLWGRERGKFQNHTPRADDSPFINWKVGRPIFGDYSHHTTPPERKNPREKILALGQWQLGLKGTLEKSRLDFFRALIGFRWCFFLSKNAKGFRVSF